MTVASDEFIRRFLLHVLPEGFHRIRYYCFLGNRYRAQKLAHCRDPLGIPSRRMAHPKGTTATATRISPVIASGNARPVVKAR